jgi:transcriptional regulator with XRE-family HTH domain
MPRNPKSVPSDLEFRKPGADDAQVGEATFFREHKASFGPYLRALREQRGLSLRDAAAQLGLSFAKLQKMETGGRFRLPSLEFLLAIADFYDRPHAELLNEAGIRVIMPEDIEREADRDSTFADLVLHPDLRPTRMDLTWTESFSTVQKNQWIEFARKLAEHPDPKGLLDEILQGRGA